MRKEKKIAIAIVLLCIILLPVGGFFAWKFINHTNLRYVAPKGTLPYFGEQLAKKYFPGELAGDPLYLLATSHNTSKSILKDPKFEAFSYYLRDQVKNESSSIFNSVHDIVGFFLVRDVGNVRDTFIGGKHNESSMLRFGIEHSGKGMTVIDAIKSLVDQWCEEHNVHFTREYTNIALLSQDASVGIVEDLERVDVISLPLAFLVLVYCVGSVRLLLIPALTLPSTVALAFSIMYPISFAVEVSSFAPELALGVVAAVSVDYSLFILTRFCEQVLQQELLLGCSEETEWVVVKNTAVLSAHNILVSGLTIAVAVGSLSFLPIDFLSTIGITMSIGVVCAVFLSLTIQPALLLTFYDFFAHPPTWTEWWEKISHCVYSLFSSSCCSCFPCCRHQRRPVKEQQQQQRGRGRGGGGGSSHEVTVSEEENETHIQYHSSETPKNYTPSASPLVDHLPIDHEITQADLEVAEYKRQISSPWFRIGQFSIHHPYIAILSVLLFGAPFFYFVTELRVDFNVFSEVPHKSPHSKVLEQIVSIIGGGSAIPFYIIFSVRGTYDVSFWNTDEMTNLMRSVIEAIVRRTGQTYSSITAPNMIENPIDKRVMWLGADESQGLYILNEDYQYLVNRTVYLEDKKTAYIILSPPVDPFGSGANKYLNTLRDIIHEHAAENVFFDYGITGASSASWCIMSKSVDFFPLQIGLILGGIFLFILFVFRTAILPIRMIFTVVYTIAVSLGVGVIVFQYKWLHPVWKALENVENYDFLIPIFSFMLLAALALDYDVFLMTRVIEFKTLGYTNEAAIAKAVWKTGPIISFAGLIMFVTIGSMVFSSVIMLSQFAVVCSAAVLLDTFVVRPFFVPALLSVVPASWLWWPRKFPELNRGVEDMRFDPNIVRQEEQKREEEEEGREKEEEEASSQQQQEEEEKQEEEGEERKKQQQKKRKNDLEAV
ncbi:uncharacterized protein TM35_000342270 [Trypanosoma theileri]|uniref:SSD domain-containing protein n=1 Tax=Trypanosoma theileri TaxID=67003 RepID=A0A1X0NLN2_9TRYP|nr:uncharacterized protein TM35_000342270 [Trypanosoma theileri]ORC85615.1 hypothetical protein TM35_000342270 [Trypanosoma theileri]